LKEHYCAIKVKP